LGCKVESVSMALNVKQEAKKKGKQAIHWVERRTERERERETVEEQQS